MEIIMAQYISVTEALKLVCPFKGDKREVLAFISNVDTAFEVIDPEQADILYRFVLTQSLRVREILLTLTSKPVMKV